MSVRTFTERDIHLALDGELPQEERAAFDAWLEANPGMKRAHERFAADRDLLRRTFAPVVQEPLPARLSAFAGSPARDRAAWPWWRAAAAVLIFIAGGAAGYLYGAPGVTGLSQPEARVADDAVAAHEVYASEKLHVVEVGADQKDHLVGWLSKRVGTRLVAPDLTRLGYNLVGGRLLPAQGRPAAQFMYQNPEGVRVSLYVTHGVHSGETGFRILEDDGARACYWLDEGFAYVVTGEIPEEQLLAMANSVYRQLLAAQEGSPPG